MRTYIYPYNMGSQSSKDLALKLECKRVYPDRNYTPRGSHLVINWGNSQQPNWGPIAVQAGTTIINKPTACRKAINKAVCLQILKDNNVSCVDSTTNRVQAQEWLDNEKTVVVRAQVNGHGGAGITLVQPGEELPNAPLYTIYTKKKDEFRVHVFNGQVIDVQQKRKQNGEQPANMQIRNHGNGWIFARENVQPDQTVLDESIKAVAALGLDFAAVDIGWNSFYKKAHIYELNCAPGLEGTSLDIYAEQFNNLALEAENF